MKALLIVAIIAGPALAETPAEAEARRKRIEAAQKLLQKDKASKAGDLKAENAKLRAEVARLKAQIAKLRAQVVALGGKVEAQTVKAQKAKLTPGTKTSVDQIVALIPKTALPKAGVSPNVIYLMRLDKIAPRFKGLRLQMTADVFGNVSAYNGEFEKNGYEFMTYIKAAKYLGRRVGAKVFWVLPRKYESDLADVGRGTIVHIKGQVMESSLRVGSDYIEFRFVVSRCTLISVAQAK